MVCYTDSVDEEDLCEVPEIRTAGDMLPRLSASCSEAASQAWPSTEPSSILSCGRMRRHDRIRSCNNFRMKKWLNQNKKIFEPELKNI